MVKSFKEIQVFFRKKEFSQEELVNLKENLLSIYGKEKSTLNAINSSINLNLIHYKISGPVNTSSEQTKPPKPRKISKKEKIKIKLEKKAERKLKELESKFIDNFLKYTIDKPIKKAAIYLGMETENFKNKLFIPKEFQSKNLDFFDNDLWVFNEKWIKRRLNYNRKAALPLKDEFTPEVFYRNAKGKSLEDVAMMLELRESTFIRLCNLSNTCKLPKSFNDNLKEKNKKWINQRLKKLSKINLKLNITGPQKKSNNSSLKKSDVYSKLKKTKNIKPFIYNRM